MTYALASHLQTALYTALTSHVPLTDIIGDRIYDAPPAGPRPDLYVALGPEQVRDRSDKTGDGAVHDLTISVVSDLSGFTRAKDVAAIISDLLHGADLPLTRGALVYLNFTRARAIRVRNGASRRIDMTFRARVSDETPA